MPGPLTRLRRRVARFGAPATVDERLAQAAPEPADRILLIKTPPWDTRLPPLGIGYLSSYLASHGIEAPVWDCNIDTYLRFRMDRSDLWDMETSTFWFSPERVAEVFNHEADLVVRRILEEDTPYVGLSLTMEGIQFARLVSDRLRRDAPDKILVVGGPGVAFREYRDLFPRGSVDLFVVGAGEEALRQLLLHGITPDGPRRGDPSPDLELWRDRPDDPDAPLCLRHPLGAEEVVLPTFDGYDLVKYLGRDHLALIMSRGCFRSCAFCSDRPDQGAFRAFDFERLMGAIAYYKEHYWIGGITWNDLILNGNLKHLERYCDVLIENSVDLVWDGQATAHRVMNKHPALFHKLAEAGCTDLTYGLESFSEDVLGFMNKGYHPDTAVETLRLTREAGMVTGINMICGFPGETEAHFEETLRALEEHREHIDRLTSLSVCAVMPGSDLWNNPQRYNIELPPLGQFHKWETRDGSNTLEVRRERHARMKQKARELGLSAVVQATEDF